MKIHMSMNYDEDEWESMMSSWEQELNELVGEGNVTIIEPDDDLIYSPELRFTIETTPEIAHVLKTMLKVFYGLESPMRTSSVPQVEWEEEPL